MGWKVLPAQLKLQWPQEEMLPYCELHKTSISVFAYHVKVAYYNGSNIFPSFDSFVTVIIKDSIGVIGKEFDNSSPNFANTQRSPFLLVSLIL
jgi:hypothetical protein